MTLADVVREPQGREFGGSWSSLVFRGVGSRRARGGERAKSGKWGRRPLSAADGAFNQAVEDAHLKEGYRVLGAYVSRQRQGWIRMALSGC